MKSIDFLFLVGGMSKMKKIREKLKELTDMDPQSFADPCEAPTLGACILGAHLLMKDSPEIMFQRNSIFFDNLEVFEKVLLDDDLMQKLIHLILTMMMIFKMKMNRMKIFH